MALLPGGLHDRARVLHALRAWFADRGYLEVPTPVLVPSPAMEEHLHPLAAEGGFLRTSPEFALKRVLAAGLPRHVVNLIADDCRHRGAHSVEVGNLAAADMRHDGGHGRGGGDGGAILCHRATSP